MRLRPTPSPTVEHAVEPNRSAGQPEASHLEPTHFEVGEEERGERDDVIRGLMDVLAKHGRDLGIPEEQLEGYGPSIKEGWDGSLKLYRLLSGHYRHHLTAVGPLKSEAAQQTVPFVEEVDAGFIFVATALRVTAPKGSRLLLFENNTAPTSFREVVTNVQQFSGEIPGLCLWAGPCRLLAVVEECEAAGQLTVRLEGQLVPREFIPRV